MNPFKRKEVDRLAMPSYSPIRFIERTKSEPRVAYTITPNGEPWDPNDWVQFAKVKINSRLHQ